MLNQIGILLDNFPSIPFSDILQWATLNGAQALNIDDFYGSIDIGKNPGLNLITNFNFSKMLPTNSSKIHRLI